MVITKQCVTFLPRYMFYLGAVRKDTKAALEATSEGKVSVGAVAKAVAAKWRAMSQEDKAPYQRMHEEAKARNENAEEDTKRKENAKKDTKRKEIAEEDATQKENAKEDTVQKENAKADKVDVASAPKKRRRKKKKNKKKKKKNKSAGKPKPKSTKIDE